MAFTKRIKDFTQNIITPRTTPDDTVSITEIPEPTDTSNQATPASSYDPNATYQSPELNEFGYDPNNPAYSRIKSQYIDPFESDWDKYYKDASYRKSQEGTLYKRGSQPDPMSREEYWKSYIADASDDPLFQEYSDYELAAEQEWRDEQEALRVEQANRPNIVTPGATQTWTTDPVTGQQTATVALDEDEQAIYDADIKFKKDVSDIRDTALQAGKETLETPFTIEGQAPTYTGPTGDMPTLGKTAEGDIPKYTAPDAATPTYQGPSKPVPTGDITAGLGGFQGYEGLEGGVPTYAGMEGDVPTYEGIRDEVRQSLLSRVEGDVQRDREQRHAQLIAQGIPPGSEAYIDEMQQFDRQLTDARQRAEVTATQIASQEYQNILSGRKQEQSEVKDQFTGDVASRELDLTEKEMKFRNDIMERGMKTQEAQQTFENALATYGFDRQDRLDQLQADSAAYATERQKAMDDFSTKMQQYGITRQESIDLFNSEMQARGMESAEDFNKFNAEMATHKQNVADALLERSIPLNEMQIMTGGQQISIPAFVQGGMAQFTPGADNVGISQFSQNQDLQIQNMLNNLQIASDNRDTAQVNNILNGLFGLGAAVIAA